MNKRAQLFLGTIQLLWIMNALAQSDTTFLTLTDCILITRERGPLAKIARYAYDSRRSAYEAFSSTYYPQLSLQGDMPGYYRSINTIILPDGSSIFTPQSQATSSLNLSLSQKIPFTGGEVSLSSGLNRIDLLESRSKYYRSNPFSISFRQPIFQFNTMKWSREAEGLRYQMAKGELAEAMEESAIDVTNKFFDFYLATMNLSNTALNLSVNDTLFQISKGRFNVGKIAENDLLQSELAYVNAQTQLENARLAFSRSEQALKIVLGLPATSHIALRVPSEIPDVRLDPITALSQARLNRSDILNFELQRLTAEQRVAQAESDNSFSATMTMNLGYNQRAQGLSDAYQNLLDQRLFSIRFDVPIFRWGAGSSAVDAALADQGRTNTFVEQQLRDFEQEVRYQVSRLNLLQKQVAVAARADTIAERRYSVAKNRYLIGKIDVPNLFLAQSEKDNARRAHVQTLWDFWVTYFRVRKLTLYDFESHQPLVEKKNE